MTAGENDTETLTVWFGCSVMVVLPVREKSPDCGPVMGPTVRENAVGPQFLAQLNAIHATRQHAIQYDSVIVLVAGIGQTAIGIMNGINGIALQLQAALDGLGDFWFIFYD